MNCKEQIENHIISEIKKLSPEELKRKRSGIAWVFETLNQIADEHEEIIVTYCRECKYCACTHDGDMYCIMHEGAVIAEDYCSSAEKVR